MCVITCQFFIEIEDELGFKETEENLGETSSKKLKLPEEGRELVIILNRNYDILLIKLRMLSSTEEIPIPYIRTDHLNTRLVRYSNPDCTFKGNGV
jgi:hypothetical protein